MNLQIKSIYTRAFMIFGLVSFIIIISSFSVFSQYKVRTVVLDAGHGGKDSGALGKKSKEKDITLKIALKVGEYIKKYVKGVKVIYTRTTDKFIELHRRTEIANKNNADVFISIHVNSNKSSTPRGTSSFVMGISKSEENLEIAKKENSVILQEQNYKENYKGYEPSSAESHIIFSLLQNVHLEQSLLLASKVQKQFKYKAGRKDRGVKQKPFIVLWTATMPSILVETGFISNPAEERFLMSSNGQSIIASAIYRAFKEYKNEIEKKSKYTSKPYHYNQAVRQQARKENEQKDKQQTESKHIKQENRVTQSEKEHNIIFRVQIKSSSVPIKGKIKGLQYTKEHYSNGVYKYYVGETKSFKKIVRLQREARKKIPDAFAVAFKNEQRISMKQALREIKAKSN